LPPISRPLMFMRLFALNSISYLIWIWQMLGTGADAHLLPFSYPDPSSTASSPVHLTVVTGRLKSRRKVGAKPFLLSPLSQAMSVETADPSQIPLSTVILVPGFYMIIFFLHPLTWSGVLGLLISSLAPFCILSSHFLSPIRY
jgi:hypothetical protein